MSLKSSSIISNTKSPPQRTETALIPACWLVTPFNKAAWPNILRTNRVNSHLSNLFLSAVLNVERAGHTLDHDDREYLRLIISYWCGWSATAEAQKQDSAFQYIRHRYATVGNLEPILDDMTYVEEVPWMPQAVILGIATTLLLATPDRFYVYVVEVDSLLDAGATLKEVYEGLRKSTSVLTMYGSGWEATEPFETNLDSISYFPDYHPFRRFLIYDIPPFVVPDMSRWNIESDDV